MNKLLELREYGGIVMELRASKNDGMIKQIITGMTVSLGVTLVSNIAQFIKSTKLSIIDVGVWDSSYNNINKMLYKLNPDEYIKHRYPTTNKEVFELSDDISYFVQLKNGNYAKVETYKDKGGKYVYPEPRLKIQFLVKTDISIGKNF